MATLRQDVWLAVEPRRRGVRLGPFGDAPARVFVCPEPGTRLDDAPLAGLLDGLAERLEVVAYEQSDGAASDAHAALRSIESIEHRWGREIPLVVLGLGSGASAALALAQNPSVRAIALVNPNLPSTPGTGEPRAGDASVGGRHDQPLLLLTSRVHTGLSSAALDALAAHWPQLDVILLPGDDGAGARAPWPAVLAEWAAWAVGTR